MHDIVQCMHSTEPVHTALKQHHRQPGFRRRERCKQPRGAGADHHDRINLVCRWKGARAAVAAGRCLRCWLLCLLRKPAAEAAVSMRGKQRSARLTRQGNVSGSAHVRGANMASAPHLST